MTRQHQSSGFILPVTLWLIAAIGLVAALLSEWVSQAVTSAIALQEKMESEIALSNIQNEIVFAFGRRPFSYRGLEVGSLKDAPSLSSLNEIMGAEFSSDSTISMDGRSYVILSDQSYTVQIYDGRGLVNLNRVGKPELERLFELLNVSPDMADQLSGTLRDYRDEDDFESLSGAERSDYERLDLPPPANAKLMTPWEGQRVLGWKRLSELWTAQFERPIMTTCMVSGFNPNTAPIEALVAHLDGVSPEAAQMVSEQREQLPFRNIRNVGDAAGVILTAQPFAFSFKPATCFVAELTNQETGNRLRFSMSLLPSSKSQPWQIDYVLRLPKTAERAVDRLDQSRYFPSPEEIARRSGGTDNLTGL